MDRRLRLLQLDETDATPLYVQLARKLTSAIETGQWSAGEALPSERTLVDTLGISRVTARKAMQVLDDQGAIRRTRGAGTFIAPKFEQKLSRLDNFSEMVRPHGLTPTSELVASERRIATDAERTSLALREGEAVIALTRLRKADGMLISMDSSVLPASVLPDAERIGESLYAYLDRIDKPVLRALQHFRATVADTEAAARLQVAVGEPLLLVTRLGFTHNDVPVESTRTWCINDYYDFVIELRR